MTLDDTQYNSRYGAMKKITVLLYAIDSLDTIKALLLQLLIQILLILTDNV